MRRRKLRNVRYRQWVRWLRIQDDLNIRGGRLKVAPSWYPRERWSK